GSAPAGGLELRFRRRTGERIDVLLQITPLKDPFGNITGWVSSCSDITERKRARTRLAAEHTITRLLASAPSLHAVAPGIIDSLLNSLEVDCGLLWMPEPKSDYLRCVVAQQRGDSSALQMFVAASVQRSLAQGLDLPGRVWEERQPIWM